jgi:hypothetical protein
MFDHLPTTSEVPRRSAFLDNRLVTKFPRIKPSQSQQYTLPQLFLIHAFPPHCSNLGGKQCKLAEREAALRSDNTKRARRTTAILINNERRYIPLKHWRNDSIREILKGIRLSDMERSGELRQGEKNEDDIAERE